MTPTKQARQAANLTIYDVAKSVGLDASSVSRIERGDQRATAKTAEALAKVLGISEEKVLYPERFQGSRRKRKTA